MPNIINKSFKRWKIQILIPTNQPMENAMIKISPQKPQEMPKLLNATNARNGKYMFTGALVTLRSS